MTLTKEIEISAAHASERGAIQHMMQLYTYDFTELWSGLERGELGDDGLFPAYLLDPYWREPDYLPFLVRRAGHLIGFVLLNRDSHALLPVDRNMAEFFIVRKHRRNGVGRHVAHAMFTRYPGQWEASVARLNTAALAFWQRAIASHPDVADIEEHDINDARWNGAVLRFNIEA